MTNKELIEFVFYHEQDIKRAVFEKREDGCLPKTGGSGSGHCRVSDPTAQNAIRKALEVPAVIIEYGAKTCGHNAPAPGKVVKSYSCNTWLFW